jgi:hypothetical protein
MAQRGGRGYAELITAMRLVQNRLAAAAPPPDVVRAVTSKLEQVGTLLAPYEVSEWEAPIGTRLDLPGRGHPLLLPLVIDEWTDTVVRGRVTFPRYYLGGNGAAHGGTLPLLFDEVMGRLSNGGGRSVARTAYLHVNYRSITPIDRELEIEVTFDRQQGRKRYVTGRLRDGDVLLADAEGLFVELRPGQP